MLIEPLPTEALDPSLLPFTQKSTLANMATHALGRRPETLRRWYEFYQELTRTPGSVSLGHKELIRHQIASLYGCQLCRSFVHPCDVGLAKAARVLDPDDSFTPAEKAMLDFTRRLYEGPAHLDESHFQRLREFFSEEQITEIGFVAAMLTGWGRLTFGFRVVDAEEVHKYVVPGSLDEPGTLKTE